MERGSKRDSRPTLGWRRPAAQAPQPSGGDRKQLSQSLFMGLALLCCSPPPRPGQVGFPARRRTQVRDTAIESRW